VIKESVSATKKKMGLIGASMALEAIERETANIYAAFPELRPTGNQTVQEAPRKTGKDGRSRWTAKRKREVSERMKKYWAKRNKKRGATREQKTAVSAKAKR
jgi:hypothetical protein